MFTRSLGGEVSLQPDMLQWVSHPRTWGCGGYNLENDPETCCHYQQVSHIRRNGAIQSGELLSPYSLTCWAAPGIRHPVSGSPPTEGQKEAGNWRGFSWRVFKMFCDLQQMFWDLWGEAEETGWVGVCFCPTKKKSLRRLRCILIAACNSLKGSSKGGRAKPFLVARDGKKRRTREEFVPEDDQAQQKLPQEVGGYWHR